MGPVIEMQVTCAAAPLQLKGRINGKTAGFHSEPGHWALCVAATVEEASARTPQWWTWHGSRLVTHEKTARAIIARCVAGWTGWDGARAGQGEG